MLICPSLPLNAALQPFRAIKVRSDDGDFQILLMDPQMRQMGADGERDKQTAQEVERMSGEGFDTSRPMRLGRGISP